MPDIIICRNTYEDTTALKHVLDYVCRTALVGGYGIDPNYAFSQMMMIKRTFHKLEGKQLEHFFISFADKDILSLDLNDLMSIGFQVGKLFQSYQMIYALHLDSKYAHLHFVMNTVSFSDGHKYSQGITKFSELKALLHQQFPYTDSGIYFSYPLSTNQINVYSESNENSLLRIDTF